MIHLAAHPEEAEPDTATNHESVAELHVCIAHMLGATMHSTERFKEMLPVWTKVDSEDGKAADPPAAPSSPAGRSTRTLPGVVKEGYPFRYQPDTGASPAHAHATGRPEAAQSALTRACTWWPKNPWTTAPCASPPSAPIGWAPTPRRARSSSTARGTPMKGTRRSR